MRPLLSLALCLVLASGVIAQDDGAPPPAPVPPPVPVQPTFPGAPPGGFPPPAGVPGGVPPGGALPPGTIPGSGTGTGTTGGTPTPTQSGNAPPPIIQPSPGGGTPSTGAPSSGGGGGQIYRVTQDRLLGPARAMRERGRGLFASPTLGRTTLSCSSCHRPEDLRPIARVYPRFNPFLRSVATLEQAQNACLSRFMRGSPLPAWSRNATALSMFLVME